MKNALYRSLRRLRSDGGALERTVSDDAFRARLFSHPDEALADFDLTGPESEALCDLCFDAGQSQSEALDRRETRKVLPFSLTGGL